MVLGKTENHRQKNETGPLSYTNHRKIELEKGKKTRAGPQARTLVLSEISLKERQILSLSLLCRNLKAIPLKTE